MSTYDIVVQTYDIVGFQESRWALTLDRFRSRAGPGPAGGGLLAASRAAAAEPPGLSVSGGVDGGDAADSD